METADLISLVEQLEDNIDDLEENLEPLLATALSVTTKKLPLLDKAKLYALVVYSIESLLFSFLRLNGVQAKEHPVFKELTRVKQYFEKIKEAESGPVKPRENLSLNKQAAARIITQALASNDKYDAERRERELREKLLAKRKLRDLEKSMKQKEQEIPEQVEASNTTDSEEEEGEIKDDVAMSFDGLPALVAEAPVDPQLLSQQGRKQKKNKKRKRDKQELYTSSRDELDSDPDPSNRASPGDKKVKGQRKMGRHKKIMESANV